MHNQAFYANLLHKTIFVPRVFVGTASENPIKSEILNQIFELVDLEENCLLD
jgi:hypothetical protein